MELMQIYRPIKKELKKVEEALESSLKESKNESILEVSKYLLGAQGKRLRPALLLLSARASSQQPETSNQLLSVACAVELIHMASLIHDDVIDKAYLRHNRPSINIKWGSDVSIALGDYLYSKAFDLISRCKDPDILSCISQATHTMCEGELIQVCERDNLDLAKSRYIVIVKKKSASLFAASCQAGAIISSSNLPIQKALKEYGLNLGIAFQIIDDYLDLVGEEGNLGKSPGQDLKMGEATLPLLNLWESVSREEREELRSLLSSRRNRESLERIKSRLFSSGATLKTKEVASSYMTLAKEKINILSDSPFRRSLIYLTDYILERAKR